MTTTIALQAMITLLVAPQGGPSTAEIVQSGLRDLSFTAVNKKGDQAELEKINKDFGETYRFSSIKVWAKEPFKVRVESRVKDTDMLYVLNGTTRVYSIPRAKIHQTEHLAGAPGKRQTWLDFGLLTRSLLDDLFDVRYVRLDRATGDWVFDLTYPSEMHDTSRHRIWVDRTKHFTVKREWYNQKGKQLATFFYENPTQVDGVWVPTKVTVRNVDDQVAGITEYTHIRVNAGISESLFNVD